MVSKQIINKLQSSAQVSRQICVAAIYYAQSGHPGGSLSCVDILVQLFQSKKIGKSGSDSHLILSKGHAAPALYAVATEFEVLSPEEIKSFRKLDSRLQGHPYSITTPWATTSTGSLGQGFSVGMGMALGFKYQKKFDNVFVVMGDGEMQEGEVWEAAMAAAHHNLNNLRVIIDYNKLQSDDLNSNIMGIEPLADKWRAFKWQVIEIDGHDFQEIGASLNSADQHQSGPTVIIAHTIKGKGVKYMENVPTWHGSVTMSEEELRIALTDLGASNDLINSYINGAIEI